MSPFCKWPPYINMKLLFNSSVHCPQTDEERQQALQAFSAQSALSSSSSSVPSGSPHGHSEYRPKAKKVLRKNQNEKYRLKYLRLRKAARAMIFVSRVFLIDLIVISEKEYVEKK